MCCSFSGLSLSSSLLAYFHLIYLITHSPIHLLLLASYESQAARKQFDKEALQRQRHYRRKRIRQELEKLKEDFQKKWVAKREEYLEAARLEALEYLNDPTKMFEVKRKIAHVREKFFEPPLPENQDREKVISSPLNIAFLFFEAKLRQKKLSVRKAVKIFDSEKKGTLRRHYHI
jgi:hypothetical protein